jgi:hypothetical protein
MVITASKKAANPATTAHDVAEHLRTPQKMAAYLNAWLEQAPDDVSGIARARRHRPHRGDAAGRQGFRASRSSRSRPVAGVRK